MHTLIRNFDLLKGASVPVPFCHYNNHLHRLLFCVLFLKGIPEFAIQDNFCVVTFTLSYKSFLLLAFVRVCVCVCAGVLDMQQQRVPPVCCFFRDFVSLWQVFCEFIRRRALLLLLLLLFLLLFLRLYRYLYKNVYSLLCFISALSHCCYKIATVLLLLLLLRHTIVFVKLFVLSISFI